MSLLTTVPAEAQELAEEVNLRYVSDDTPGISRFKNGKKFSYYNPQGKRINKRKTLKRIEDLKIPPAWRDIWICRLSFGHLQATGRDEKGRKQYIYHTKWNEVASHNKFDNILVFSGSLPQIRTKISQDMRLTGLPQERILATIVWLLDNTYIRVGNEEYAKDSGHYGLTTLRSRHVEITGSSVTFEFTGKSGKKHHVGITHPKVLKTIKKLEELPGYELFQYLDEKGNRRPIDSQSVNDYLKHIAKDTISAKDFRTWGGTVLAGQTLKKIGDFSTKRDLKRNITQAVTTVSKNLGNTPKVCRNYYVHPTIVSTYKEKILVPHFLSCKKSKIRGLDKGEYATTTLLKAYS